MGFEDEDTVPAGGRSVRSKKKGTRKSKKRGTAQAATAAELMPEGALDSSDDEAGRSGKRKQKHRTTRRNGDGEEDLELGDVDVTVPLRDDEIIPVSRHRSPCAVERAPGGDTAAEEKHREADETGAKKKKKKIGRAHV